MTIGFYGKLRDLIAPQLELELPRDLATVADLRAFLAAVHPAAAEEMSSDRLQVALDDRMAGDTASLAGARSADFFPAVSGG